MSATNSNVTIGTSSTNILPRLTNGLKRTHLVISNVSDTDVFVSFGGIAVLNTGVPLKSGTSISMNYSDDSGLISEEINAISTASGKVVSFTVIQ